MKANGQVLSPLFPGAKYLCNRIISRHVVMRYQCVACVVHLCLFPGWYRIPPSPTEPFIMQFVPTSHDCMRRRMQQNGQLLLVSARGSSCNMHTLRSRSDRSKGRRLLCWQRKRNKVLITIHKTGPVNVRPASRLILDFVTLTDPYIPSFLLLSLRENV
jgi:hypothetical protein